MVQLSYQHIFLLTATTALTAATTVSDTTTITATTDIYTYTSDTNISTTMLHLQWTSTVQKTFGKLAKLSVKFYVLVTCSN